MENNTSNTPVSGAKQSQLQPSVLTRRQTALVLAASLILPPLGLILVIYNLVRRHDREVIMLAVTSVIAAVIGGLAYLGIYDHYHHSVKPTHNLSVQYSVTNPETVSLSPKAGEGVSVQKPNGFTNVTTNQAADARFMTLQSSQGAATITFGSTETDGAGDSSVINGFNNFLKSPSGSGAVTYEHYWQDFLSPLMSGYQLEYTTPQVFNSDNVKSGAAIIDFNATDNTNVRVPMSGYIVVVIGKNAVYYLVVSSSQNNWQPNQTIWTTVGNSLKVDL